MPQEAPLIESFPQGNMQGLLDPADYPDFSGAVTENEDAATGLFAGRQARLLVESLYASWRTEDPFTACAGVGLILAINRPAAVPDVLLSLGVQPPRDLMMKMHRAYFICVYGKNPDLVIGIVSNREGGERTRKMAEYARIGIAHYAIFDPGRQIQESALESFVLHGGIYIRQPAAEYPFGLRLVEWRGVYEGSDENWLRWTDAEGNLLRTGQERAEREAARGLLMAEKLRSLGVDPDAL